MATPLQHSTASVVETIDSKLLTLCGVFKNYSKDEYIFRKGHRATFHHQVVEGRVKLISDTSDDNEFIQGIINPGQFFGEVALLDGGYYAASAITDLPPVIYKIRPARFF